MNANPRTDVISFIPNSYSTPNAFADRLMHLLEPTEWKVLSCITRHILGWHDKIASRAGAVSLTVLENGFTTEDGVRYFGTGLSRPTIVHDLDNLVKYKVIAKIGKPGKKGQVYRIPENDKGIDYPGLNQRILNKSQEGQKRTRIASERSSQKRFTGKSDVPALVNGIYHQGYVPHTSTGKSDVPNISISNPIQIHDQKQDLPVTSLPAGSLASLDDSLTYPVNSLSRQIIADEWTTYAIPLPWTFVKGSILKSDPTYASYEILPTFPGPITTYAEAKAAQEKASEPPQSSGKVTPPVPHLHPVSSQDWHDAGEVYGRNGKSVEQALAELKPFGISPTDAQRFDFMRGWQFGTAGGIDLHDILNLQADEKLAEQQQGRDTPVAVALGISEPATQGVVNSAIPSPASEGPVMTGDLPPLPAIMAPAYFLDGSEHMIRRTTKNPNVCLRCKAPLSGAWSQNPEAGKTYTRCARPEPPSESGDPVFDWVARRILENDAQTVYQSKRLGAFCWSLVAVVVNAEKRLLKVDTLSQEARSAVALDLPRFLEWYAALCPDCHIPAGLITLEKYIGQWYAAGKAGAKNGKRPLSPDEIAKRAEQDRKLGEELGIDDDDDD